MSRKAAVNITNSSHPDFRYFVELRDGQTGRQMTARRFNTDAEVDKFTQDARAAAEGAGVQLDIRDSR